MPPSSPYISDHLAYCCAQNNEALPLAHLAWSVVLGLAWRYVHQRII